MWDKCLILSWLYIHLDHYTHLCLVTLDAYYMWCCRVGCKMLGNDNISTFIMYSLSLSLSLSLPHSLDAATMTTIVDQCRKGCAFVRNRFKDSK